MLDLRREEMSPAFSKWHVGGMPFAAVLHRFSAPDHGFPHDHPWCFQSHILHGGYEEEVFDLHTGKSRMIERLPGSSHFVHASHIHRIPRLLDGECWTIIKPIGPQRRESGFYDFRPDGVYHRFWHEPEFSLLNREDV